MYTGSFKVMQQNKREARFTNPSYIYYYNEFHCMLACELQLNITTLVTAGVVQFAAGLMHICLIISVCYVSVLHHFKIARVLLFTSFEHQQQVKNEPATSTRLSKAYTESY